MNRNLSLMLAALLALLVAAPAQAANRFTIRGAGYGHGVGMSQYGAMGYASHGWTHDRILAHYYRGTALSRLDAGQPWRLSTLAACDRDHCCAHPRCARRTVRFDGMQWRAQQLRYRE